MATSTPVRHAWRALTGLLVITALLFGINALGVYVFKQSSWAPSLALDLQGGTQIILEAQTEDALKSKWSLLKGGETVVTLPRAAVLRQFLMNHLVHHRGQLTVYLRMLDIPVPALYGPSADED